MAKSLNELSAAEAARRIAAGDTTSEALVSACLERIAARDGDVQAWAHVDKEKALAQARVLDRGPRRGPLHGVPFGIKDVIDTAELRTEYNSPIYRGHQPRWDAASVALLKHAGCVILGKTVTTEFAHNHPSQTRNPHNLAHTPGGSSSGSAAAVADYMVAGALGTQTGGSTIRPAAFCGVVAIKPSFNSINRAGLKFAAESLDTIGILTRSVEDAALSLEALSGRASPDFTRAPGSAPRIGLCRTPRWSEADGPTQSTLESLAQELARAGARVVDFDLPPGSERMFKDHDTVMGYESARALAWEYFNFPDKLSASLKPRLDEGWKFSRQAYDEMCEFARGCRREFTERMREVDFLLSPSAPGEAPKTLATTGSSVFNRAWTLLGVPCVTLPRGKGPGGLPLGIQLIADYNRDADLLSWAHWVERRIG
jgi:amidase